MCDLNTITNVITLSQLASHCQLSMDDISIILITAHVLNVPSV